MVSFGLRVVCFVLFGCGITYGIAFVDPCLKHVEENCSELETEQDCWEVAIQSSGCDKSAITKYFQERMNVRDVGNVRVQSWRDAATDSRRPAPPGDNGMNNNGANGTGNNNNNDQPPPQQQQSPAPPTPSAATITAAMMVPPPTSVVNFAPVAGQATSAAAAGVSTNSQSSGTTADHAKERDYSDDANQDEQMAAVSRSNHVIMGVVAVVAFLFGATVTVIIFKKCRSSMPVRAAIAVIAAPLSPSHKITPQTNLVLLNRMNSGIKWATPRKVAPMEICPICMDNNSNATCVPCGHAACQQCLSAIMSKGGSCPMCRGDIYSLGLLSP